MSKIQLNGNSIRDGMEHDPGGGKALIDPTDTVLLLLDHQSGLFQVVKDVEVSHLRANTAMLVKLAILMASKLDAAYSAKDEHSAERDIRWMKRTCCWSKHIEPIRGQRGTLVPRMP